MFLRCLDRSENNLGLYAYTAFTEPTNVAAYKIFSSLADLLK